MMAYARMHAIRFLNAHQGMGHTPPEWERDNSHDGEHYEAYFSLGELTIAMAECCGEYARKIRRRQHAVTVWNAMAAVVAVAAAFEVGYCMLDKAVSDAKMRELIARCNWEESKPQ